MNCELIIICAVAANGGIGRDGDLAFHISADLKRFKALTSGHTVVMGRKTFESLPKGPLPNRRNIVITRNPGRLVVSPQGGLPEQRSACARGFETAPSLEAAIAMAEAAGETELFIIGGGQIYAAAMPMANRLEITEIGADAIGADTYFPAIDPNEWEPAASEPWQRDEKSGADYRFVTYRKTIPSDTI